MFCFDRVDLFLVQILFVSGYSQPDDLGCLLLAVVGCFLQLKNFVRLVVRSRFNCLFRRYPETASAVRRFFAARLPLCFNQRELITR